MVAQTLHGRGVRVAIIGMLRPGMAGGIEQAVLGTVAALGRLMDGNEQYTVVVDPSTPYWLDAVLGSNTRVITYPRAAWRTLARRALSPIIPYMARCVAPLTRLRGRLMPADYDVAPFDAFLESLDVDVFHFPYQWLCMTSKPSLFNPQDVQYIHHPEFFDAVDLEHRRNMYPRWCSSCAAIEVPSASTKNDLIRYLGVPPEKIAVVPKGAPIEYTRSLDSDTRGVTSYYGLPERFVLYPAQTWPHKNHLRLLEAIALLRKRFNICLNLVCTGRKNEHWPSLRRRVQDLSLERQVFFLGFIPAEDLSLLYRSAEFTVFPTLFEGGGFPLMEAYLEGSPLACSDIPVLAEQAGSAALLFDPLSSESIATALRTLHLDAALRDVLRDRGRAIAQQHSWDRTARMYRALYRKLAGHPLTCEDQQLLQRSFGGIS